VLDWLASLSIEPPHAPSAAKDRQRNNCPMSPLPSVGEGRVRGEENATVISLPIPSAKPWSQDTTSQPVFSFPRSVQLVKERERISLLVGMKSTLVFPALRQ
jgi:hypothetical protein